MTAILMPRLADAMEEGTVQNWLVSVGDPVAVGDPLVEIEVDKATMVYESPENGSLIEIAAPNGTTLAVGSVLGHIGVAGEATDAEHAPAGVPGRERVESDPRESAPVPSSSADRPDPDAGARRRPRSSPLARRIAADRGIDLSSVVGTGPSGRIVREDVERAAEAPRSVVPAAPGTGDDGVETARGSVSVTETSRLQQSVARRMAEAKGTVPHFYLTAEVNMGAAADQRSRLKDLAATGSEEPVPSFNDMVVKATALALREHPRANGSYREGHFELYGRVNVGIAVAAPEALVVPTIFDADRKGLRAIAAEARELVQRVQTGDITPPEIAGATFTVSNLGMLGIRRFEAIVNPPQSAILAVGEIADRPIARNGRVAVAPMMDLTLSCDHRILFGSDGAAFLATVKRNLETPLALAG